MTCPVGDTTHVIRPAFLLDGYQLYRCRTCGHLWTHPLPSEEELANFYDRGYFKGDASKRGYTDYDEDKASVLPEFDYFLDELERQTEGRELLDIGAATGVFMAQAIRRGWKTRGIEVSLYAAEEGKRKGLDITVGEFSNLADQFRGVSVITLWDVVEHFRDPRAVFRRMGEILPPGGLIMFATPQADSWFARLLGRFWTLLAPPQHLHYFSLASMNALLKESGFECVAIEWRGKTFDLGYIIHFVMGWRKWHWRWLDRLRQAPWVKRIKIRINPRDMMIVLAKKVDKMR